MMYAYLLITLLSGNVLFEPVGPSGTTMQSCVDLANYATGVRMASDKTVAKIETVCILGVPPK
jgi:hypothetical protein